MAKIILGELWRKYFFNFAITNLIKNMNESDIQTFFVVVSFLVEWYNMLDLALTQNRF